MAIAIIATFLNPQVNEQGYVILLVALLAGGAIGAVVAAKVVMTAMPQLVAGFHSFVGMAAVLVGIDSYMGGNTFPSHAEEVVHSAEVYLGIFIGAITFTGSLVAFGKLQGIVRSKPLLLPGRHLLNMAMAAAVIGLGYFFFTAGCPESGMLPLLIMTVIAFILGVHLVMSIGGADMPVVVSMLNSYSGWAAAATGFMLNNDLLIITGALVGSSGAILSYIMCKAMNRSIINVIFGGFGASEGSAAPTAAGTVQGEVVATTNDEVAAMLEEARSVVIIPGYGMAVARAQHPIREITDILRAKGVNVRFAIHPVAGRMPGHMNVLLAEANVPYDIVLEMDEINPEMHETDVALVVGANDTVNPGALEDPSSPIYGMPVIEAWKAKTCVVLKRSMATGYAGVENPLFFKENCRMLFGDAKKSIDGVLGRLNNK
jgi:NAD(P) transhydrogenase subunit beta